MKKLLLILCLLALTAGDFRRDRRGPTLQNKVASLKPTLWLDASDSTTLTVTAGKVSEWRSKYGAVTFTQTTGANQPLYADAGGRQNLILESESFDTTWVRVGLNGVTADAAVAPDGTTTADKIFENTATSGHQIQQTVEMIAGDTYTLKVSMKAAERTKAAFYGQDSAKDISFKIDLSDCSTSGVDADITAYSSTDVGSGWCSLSMTFVATNGGTGYIVPIINNDAGDNSYEGNGSGIYIWGAQVLNQSQISSPGYVKTTSNIVQPGINGRHAVTFDGIDDDLVSTSTLDDVLNNNAKTTFSVVAPTDGTNDGAWFGVSNGYFDVWNNGANQGLARNYDTGYDNLTITTPTFNDGRATIIVTWHDGTNLYGSTNGGSVYSIASGNTGNMTGTLRLAVGGGYPTGHNLELITFDKVLTEDIDQIERLLAKKWGVSLR